MNVPALICTCSPEMYVFFKAIGIAMLCGVAFIASLCMLILWIVGHSTGWETVGAMGIFYLGLVWLSVCMRQLGSA